MLTLSAALAGSERAGSCGTAAYRRAPVIVEDITTDPLWSDYRDVAAAHGLRACWSHPVFDSKRRVVGTFALYFREPRRPTPEHRRLIESATHLAAVAITNRREHDALPRSANYGEISLLRPVQGEHGALRDRKATERS